MWVMKCQFKQSPYSFLGLMILSMGLLMAFCTRLFERGYYHTHPQLTQDMNGFQDYDNFLNVMWLTTVTMTTVGFGDYFCKSHMGRFMSTLVAFFGILLVSLMLVSLDRTTKLNQFQALSYEFINKL
jgi:potassium intermediate/small conductance calcium-activated channel subfamily N protein 2